MFCSKCGTQNPEDAKFCSKCGAELGVSIALAAAPPPVRTWKPITAGILSIIAGACGVIGGLLVAVLAEAIARGLRSFPMWPYVGPAVRIETMAGMAIPIIILGIVAIAGGIYALRRRIWGLAIAGSICAVFGPWFLLGILAIIFVTMGKDEFK